MKDVFGMWLSGIDAAIESYKRVVPHPVYDDGCCHGRNNFVEHIHGCDVHKYWPWNPFGPFTDDLAQYCVRYSNKPEDYLSSIKTLDDARYWAEQQAAVKQPELSEFGQLIAD